MVWYLWAILGVLAIVFEVASTTFFAGFVGVGFLISALLSYLVPDSLTYQLLVALASMFVGAFVFKRKKVGDTPSQKVGQSDEFLGVRGKVTHEIGHETQGQVKLITPVLGSTQWPASSVDDTPIALGETIEIVALHSTYLVVKSIS